jgi:thioredoxin 1
MSNAVQLSDATFDQVVLTSVNAFMVDLWAEWCGPCKMIAPMVDELAGEFTGQLKVGKLNVDDNPQTAVKYGVRSIPTLLFFRNGKNPEQDGPRFFQSPFPTIPEFSCPWKKKI